MEKITAGEIREACEDWRIQLWPKFRLERELDRFFNGEGLPVGDGCDDERPASLGLGSKYVKKPFMDLMSFFDDEVGPIKAEAIYPEDVKHSHRLGRAVSCAVNSVVEDRVQSYLRSMAGRFLISGRTYGFRNSRWDWEYEQSRILMPMGAPDNVESDDFWEWGRMGQIKLKTLDEIIARNRSSSTGWNLEACRLLKKWILESVPGRDNDTRYSTSNLPEGVDEPFGRRMADSPLDCYFYYRKREDLSGRFRKVDFYIVSRWGESAGVKTKAFNTHSERKLEIGRWPTGEKDRQEFILYKQEMAFENVYECLLPFIGDARVSGDQEMAQVKGSGEGAFAKLLLQEHMARAAAEGISFGIQPNFTMEGKLDKAWIRKISEEGLNPFDFVPPGVKITEKNNAFSGMNAALQYMQMLGFDIQQDVATGDVASGFGKQSPANFKGESDAQIGRINQEVSQRNARWYKACDKYFDQIGLTLLRRPKIWHKSDAAYHDAMAIHREILEKYGYEPMDYEPKRIRLKARRVGDKQAELTKAEMVLRDPNAPPAARRYAEKQRIACLWNDNLADDLMPEDPEAPDLRQQQSAIVQNSAALASLIAMQPDPGDRPEIHLEQFHRPALLQRIQLLTQQGSMSAVDQAGLVALLQHMVMDAQLLPPDSAELYINELKGVAQLVQQKIPVQGNPEAQAAQRKEMRADALAQAQISDKESLIASRQQAAASKQRSQDFEEQARLAQLANEEVRTDAQIAQQQEEQERKMFETMKPDQQQ